VASFGNFGRVRLWPLDNAYPAVVDGDREGDAGQVAFSPDGKSLASVWSEERLRLWPLPGSGATDVRFLDLPQATALFSLAFDPKGRYLFGGGNNGRVWIVPLDGSAPRKLEGFTEETLLHAGAVSPTGRLVATAFSYGPHDKTLRVWDVETGAPRSFDLPRIQGATESGTGWERGVGHLSFANDSTLYTLGDGGLRRWNLEAGSNELVAGTAPGHGMVGRLDGERGVAIAREKRWGLWRQTACSPAILHDLKKGTSRELTEFGDCATWDREVALDPSGTVAAMGGVDGTVRVGRLSAGESHLLVGHKGAVTSVAISPDLHWVATTGEDHTLRLWPMPDLSKPPLHTLPKDELLAKLRALTNLRVVRDPSSATGWKVEVGPFPGWKKLPTW
jgi:WD40 repeat protein